MTYCGLPRTTPAYLAVLAANNDRTWFEAHRDQYQRDWLAAGLDLIEAVAPLLATQAPRLLAVPKLNQSLRRIHRDVRFSADKRPYDPALHLIFSTGPAFNKVPGFHLVLRADTLAWGAGWYGLGPADLDRYRHRVSDPTERGALMAALAAAAAAGSDLDPPDLARLPQGYAAPADWGHLLRRRGLIARTQVPQRVPGWLFTEHAPRQIEQLIGGHRPLLGWLTA